MTENSRQFDDLDRHVSDRLGKDLRDLFEPPDAVPARVDKIILDQAHRRSAKPRRLIIRLRWAAGIAAAAAVIALGVILLNPQSRLPRFARNDMIRNPQSTSPVLAEGRADVDANGRVDILDAFQLARHIEARGPVAPQWDLNGDGRIDKDDVNLVASAAVHLDAGFRGEGVPPLRREAILASLLPGHDVGVVAGVQGQDALATSLSGSPRDKGV